MIWLRSSVFLLLMALSVVLFGLPLAFVGRLFPYSWMARTGCLWGHTVLWLLKVTCGLSYRVVGADNLQFGPAIVLSKHQSAWETIALRAILPPPQTWVLKRELMRVPIFGWAVGVFDPVAIDRSAGRAAVRQLLDQGMEAIKKGRWIVIFPEGTRVAPGERKPYGGGGAMLAEKSGRPVIPIAHNAGIFWGRRSLLKQPGVIDLVIGQPIRSEGRRASEINREAEDWIESTVAYLPQSPDANRGAVTRRTVV